MKFGDVLRELLEEKMLTQKQFAEDINISASALGNYIRNLRQPDFETVCKIADYFSVSVDYLFGRSCSEDSSDDLEADLIRVFRRLTPQQQYIYIEQGKAFLK